jgi:hypothetical protein
MTKAREANGSTHEVGSNTTEPIPENVTMFLMANSERHETHLGNLIFWCVAIFAGMTLWATQIGNLYLLR